MPFHNISSDPENEYFADGVTEELINSLAQIEGLKVTARTSCFAYKGKKADVRIIGNELGVSTVLEGSIRKAGKRLRITAQLIRTDNGFHIWSESFDRELIDIFQLQDEISLLIAEKIRENFGHIEINDQLVVAKTNNIEAYQQYLKGRFYQLNWKLDDFERAIDFYKLSIKLDPQFYQPYFGIVQCYGIMAAWDVMDRPKALQEADRYLKKGLVIQSESAEGYFAQATRAFWVHWKPFEALGFLEKALAIAPNDTECLEASAECYTALGLFEEALECVDKALEFNPLSANHCYTKGNVYYLQGDFTRALQWMNKALDIDPKWELAIQIKACCFILKKNKQSLIQLIENSPVISNAPSLLSVYEARNEHRQLNPSDFDRDQKAYLPWDVYVPLYLGDVEGALIALKQGVGDHIGQYVNFINDPLLEPLRGNSVYRQLCENTFDHLSVQTVETKSTSGKQPLLNEQEVQEYSQSLRRVMDKDHLFLNPELTLRLLAENIDLHPNKLSWLMNEVIGLNFSEYVNGLRLATFQTKAGKPEYEHLTILGLAYECGFNSKTVFNEFFKKSTGQTPSAWLKSNR